MCKPCSIRLVYQQLDNTLPSFKYSQFFDHCYYLPLEFKQESGLCQDNPVLCSLNVSNINFSHYLLFFLLTSPYIKKNSNMTISFNLPCVSWEKREEFEFSQNCFPIRAHLAIVLAHYALPRLPEMVPLMPVCFLPTFYFLPLKKCFVWSKSLFQSSGFHLHYEHIEKEYPFLFTGRGNTLSCKKHIKRSDLILPLIHGYGPEQIIYPLKLHDFRCGQKGRLGRSNYSCVVFFGGFIFVFWMFRVHILSLSLFI